jgi:uncharacterized protein (DUF885 family)
VGAADAHYHEAVPGHLFQGAIAREAGELPLYRKVQGFSAYGEGWALYAERVADELGVYGNDPFGQDRLSPELPLPRRAAGGRHGPAFQALEPGAGHPLHGRETPRSPEGSAEREIERYCASPCQACSYKLGEIVISRLRGEAERSMGPRFDIRAFHDLVLLGGSMPLTVLEQRVRSWMRA